jgi:hypothetical protein
LKGNFSYPLKHVNDRTMKLDRRTCSRIRTFFLR